MALRSMKIVYGKVMAVNCTYNNTVYLHRTYACTWTLAIVCTVLHAHIPPSSSAAGSKSSPLSPSEPTRPWMYLVLNSEIAIALSQFYDYQ